MVEDDPTVDERATIDERGRTGAVAVSTKLAANRYEIRGGLGSGGMGEVLVAHDVQIGREVAIKRLHETDPTDRQVRRFLREAQIQGRLEHPSIVPVHELGHDKDGRVFFAMKKLSGTTLHDLLHAGGARQRILRALVEVCLAVEYAHVHGVIHRDLKPSNIVLGEFGEVYVLDWGVAKVMNESDELDTFEDIRSERSRTGAGVVVGTPGYMSPEQAQGLGDIDSRTDVFALGCILMEILGADPPPELAAIAVEATVRNRDVRLATARELGERIQRYLDGDRDVELRRQLARDHLTRAADLGKADTTHAHSDALGAVGRALALDPANADALRTLVALMTTLPRDVPAAAVEQMHASERELDRSRSRGGVAVILVCWIASLVLSHVVGIRSFPAVALLWVCLGVALVIGVLKAADDRCRGADKLGKLRLGEGRRCP